VARLDEAGEALWAEAQASGATLEKHEAFVRHCSAAGLLALAGRRYRERLDQQPMDPVATQMQARILAMATAGFVVPSATPIPVTRSLWFWVVIVLCSVGGMTGALFLRR
jgi:hypothetical protein